MVDEAQYKDEDDRRGGEKYEDGQSDDPPFLHENFVVRFFPWK